MIWSSPHSYLEAIYDYNWSVHFPLKIRYILLLQKILCIGNLNRITENELSTVCPTEGMP